MLVDRWIMEVLEILLAIFSVYLFFLYFGIFFQRKEGKIRALIGVAAILAWQFDIWDIFWILPSAWNLCVAMGVTIFAAANIYEGRIWMKCFFAITFVAIWMLTEILVGDLFMIYNINIGEMQALGSLISKIFFFFMIIALKKVFTNEKVRELPPKHNILLILIPIGSMYIMNAVFILTYRTEWKYAEVHSLISTVIILSINILIFYIYIKLADDLQVRHINMVYEQQLDLCERHQKETELSILQMRDVRHSMKNHFLSILAYAEKGECGKIIRFVRDVMDEGKLNISDTVNTGNIVIDSLVGYWEKAAEDRGIEFQIEIDVPMDMPFRGADISLILGNLLENAVEAADKAKQKKYIQFKLKYDKKDLLIVVKNNYRGELIRGKGEVLRTTKSDAVNHGIGLPSVRRTVEKYQGTMAIDDSMPNCFVVRVVLYGT